MARVIDLLVVFLAFAIGSVCAGIVAPRTPAPDWRGTAVVDGGFQELSSSQLKGKYYVLSFYPLDWTFVCPTELTAFSDRVDEFKALNTEVIVASIDSKFSHLSWSQTPRTKGGLGKMAIPMLSDVSKQISKDFGVLIEDPKDGDNGVALRGTFIVDPRGIVRSAVVNDLPVGRSVDEILRLLKAFQHTDVHGEVCPAGWKPGSKTMKADPNGSLDYFSTLA